MSRQQGTQNNELIQSVLSDIQSRGALDRVAVDAGNREASVYASDAIRKSSQTTLPVQRTSPEPKSTVNPASDLFTNALVTVASPTSYDAVAEARGRVLDADMLGGRDIIGETKAKFDAYQSIKDRASGLAAGMNDSEYEKYRNETMELAAEKYRTEAAIKKAENNARLNIMRASAPFAAGPVNTTDGVLSTYSGKVRSALDAFDDRRKEYMYNYDPAGYYKESGASLSDIDTLLGLWEDRRSRITDPMSDEYRELTRRIEAVRASRLKFASDDELEGEMGHDDEHNSEIEEAYAALDARRFECYELGIVPEEDAEYNRLLRIAEGRFTDNVDVENRARAGAERAVRDTDKVISGKKSEEATALLNYLIEYSATGTVDEKTKRLANTATGNLSDAAIELKTVRYKLEAQLIKDGYTKREAANTVEQLMRLGNQIKTDRRAKAIADAIEAIDSDPNGNLFHDIVGGVWNGVLGLGVGAASVVTNLTSPIGLAEAARSALSGSTFRTMDANSPLMAGLNTTNALRGGMTEAVDWNVGKVDVFDEAFGIATSTMDSVVAAFIPGEVAGVSAGGLFLGATAATQTMNDVTRNGGTIGQAFTAGIMAGTFECLFEDISIGQLKALSEEKLLWNSKSGFIRSMAKNLGKSALVNFSEETFTELANVLYDNFMGSSASSYHQSLVRYMSRINPDTGKLYTKGEADAEIAKEQALQILKAGVTGGLQGLLMGGFANVMARRSTILSAQQLGTRLKDVGSIYYGLMFSRDSQTFRLASELEAQLEAAVRTGDAESVAGFARDSRRLIDGLAKTMVAEMDEFGPEAYTPEMHNEVMDAAAEDRPAELHVETDVETRIREYLESRGLSGETLAVGVKIVKSTYDGIELPNKLRKTQYAVLSDPSVLSAVSEFTGETIEARSASQLRRAYDDIANRRGAAAVDRSLETQPDTGLGEQTTKGKFDVVADAVATAAEALGETTPEAELRQEEATLQTEANIEAEPKTFAKRGEDGNPELHVKGELVSEDEFVREVVEAGIASEELARELFKHSPELLTEVAENASSVSEAAKFAVAEAFDRGDKLLPLTKEQQMSERIFNVMLQGSGVRVEVVHDNPFLDGASGYWDEKSKTIYLNADMRSGYAADGRLVDPDMRTYAGLAWALCHELTHTGVSMSGEDTDMVTHVFDLMKSMANEGTIQGKYAAIALNEDALDLERGRLEGVYRTFYTGVGYSASEVEEILGDGHRFIDEEIAANFLGTLFGFQPGEAGNGPTIGSFDTLTAFARINPDTAKAIAESAVAKKAELRKYGRKNKAYARTESALNAVISYLGAAVYESRETQETSDGVKFFVPETAETAGLDRRDAAIEAVAARQTEKALRWMSLNWDEQMDEVATGKYSDMLRYVIKHTPSVYGRVGVADLPISFTQSKCANVIAGTQGKDRRDPGSSTFRYDENGNPTHRMSKHDIPVDVIRNLPSYLSNPVLLYESPITDQTVYRGFLGGDEDALSTYEKYITDSSRVVALIDAFDNNGYPIIVPIATGWNEAFFNLRGYTNQIVSVYGSEQFVGEDNGTTYNRQNILGYLANDMGAPDGAKGGLLYVNRASARQLFDKLAERFETARTDEYSAVVDRLLARGDTDGFVSTVSRPVPRMKDTRVAWRSHDESRRTRWSVAEKASDDRYMELIYEDLDNDVESEIRSILDEKAKRGGFTPVDLYHGTTEFGFTVPDVQASDDSATMFVTDSLDMANSYAADAGVRDIQYGREDEDGIQQVMDNVSELFDQRLEAMLGALADRFPDVFDAEYIDELRDLINSQVGAEDAGDGWADSMWEQTDQWYTSASQGLDFMDGWDSGEFGDVEDRDADFEGEADDAATFRAEYVLPLITAGNELIQMREDYESGDSGRGVYRFYGDLRGLYQVDCEGKNWNRVRVPDEFSDEYAAWKANVEAHVQDGLHDGDPAWMQWFLPSRDLEDFDEHGETTTRKFTFFILDQHPEYNGVAYRDVVDFKDTSLPRSMYAPNTVYALFNPKKQLRSADLVTYDDEGEVIPPSKRFDRRRVDVRYSVAEQDAEDRYFELIRSVSENETEIRSILDTQARKGGFVPKYLYHGTHYFGFTVPDLEAASELGQAMFVTDSIDAANSYAWDAGPRDIASADSYERLLADATDRFERSVSEFIRGYDEQDLRASVGLTSESLSNVVHTMYGKAKGNTAWTDAVYNLAEHVADAAKDGVDYDELCDRLVDAGMSLAAVETSGRFGQADGADGVYRFYGKLGRVFRFDAEGRNWDELLVPEGLKSDYDAWVARIRAEMPKGWDASTHPMWMSLFDTSDFWGAEDDMFTSTDRVIAYVRDRLPQYDSIEFRNILDADLDTNHYDEIKPNTVYALFNPKAQLRSADLVTYDDDGSVISPLDRFTDWGEDFRFSAAWKASSLAAAAEEVAPVRESRLAVSEVLDKRGLSLNDAVWSGILYGDLGRSPAEALLRWDMADIREQALAEDTMIYATDDGGVFLDPESTYEGAALLTETTRKFYKTAPENSVVAGSTIGEQKLGVSKAFLGLIEGTDGKLTELTKASPHTAAEVLNMRSGTNFRMKTYVFNPGVIPGAYQADYGMSRVVLHDGETGDLVVDRFMPNGSPQDTGYILRQLFFEASSGGYDALSLSGEAMASIVDSDVAELRAIETEFGGEITDDGRRFEVTNSARWSAGEWDTSALGDFIKTKARMQAIAAHDGETYAIPSLGYISVASHAGVMMDVQQVLSDPAVLEAAQRSKKNTTSLEDYPEGASAERDALRSELTKRMLSAENGSTLYVDGKLVRDADGEPLLAGPVERGRKAFIVLGPPGGGKSSRYANPLSFKNSARIIDSDWVKTRLPGYDNGYGAGYVNAESSNIAEDALAKAMRKGENVVIPKVGSRRSVEALLTQLRRFGYRTELYLNEVSTETSLMRTLGRAADTGRFIDPEYVVGVGDGPTRAFVEFADNKSLVDYAEWRVNDDNTEMPGGHEVYSSRGEESASAVWASRSSRGVRYAAPSADRVDGGQQRRVVTVSGRDESVPSNSGGKRNGAAVAAKRGTLVSREGGSEAGGPVRDDRRASDSALLGGRGSDANVQLREEAEGALTDRQRAIRELARNLVDSASRDAENGAAASVERSELYKALGFSGAAHRQGEKAERQVELPTRDQNGKATMKTGQSIMEARQTPDERVETVIETYDEGRLSYVPKRDRQYVKNARHKLRHDGWQDTLRSWTSDVKSGKVSGELVAMGGVLLNEAGNNQSVSEQEYADLVVNYSNLLHIAGQSLQAGRVLKMLTPEGRLYGIQRSINSMAEEYGRASGVDIRLEKSLVDQYKAATTDEERDAIVDLIVKSVAAQVPSTFADKWTALRYVNMLGNFKTQGRNVLGNTAMLALSRTKDSAAAALELFLPKEQRTKSLFVDRAWMQAAKADFDNPVHNVQAATLGEGKYNDRNAVDDFRRRVDAERTIFKFGEGRAQQRLGIAGKRIPLMESYRKVTNWAMEQGDVVFTKQTYARALAGWLKARGYTSEQLAAGAIDDDVMDEAREYAIAQAQEATFRDSNLLSNWVSRVGRHPDTPRAVRLIAEGIMPFRKTPANVLMRGVEYSPLGIIKTAIEAVQQKKSAGSVTASDIIDEAAKNLTGAGLFLLGYMLAQHGLLRGSGDEDDEEIDSLMGFQNYAIRLPNGATYTMDWLAPASLVLFTGAQLYSMWEDGAPEAAEIGTALASLADPMVSMSMMSGINDTINNVSSFNSNKGVTLFQMAGAAALNYITQGLTNSLLGQFERAFEPNRMSTTTDSDSPVPRWMQRAIGRASAKIPGWDYNQMEYTDKAGNPVSNGSVAERVLENFFSPGYYQESNEGKPYYDYLYDLHSSSDSGVRMADGYADNRMTFDDHTVKLTPEEKTRYVRTANRTYAEVVERFRNDPGLKLLSKAEQVELIGRVATYSNSTAKKELADSYGYEYTVGGVGAKVAKALAAEENTDGRITAVTYLAVTNELSGAFVPEGKKSAPGWAKADVLNELGYLTDEDRLYFINSVIYSGSTPFDTYEEAKAYYDKKRDKYLEGYEQDDM